MNDHELLEQLRDESGKYTPLFDQYLLHREKYIAARRELADLQSKVLATAGGESALRLHEQLPVLQNKVQLAENEWRAAGHKHEVDGVLATVAQHKRLNDQQYRADPRAAAHTEFARRVGELWTADDLKNTPAYKRYSEYRQDYETSTERYQAAQAVAQRATDVESVLLFQYTARELMQDVDHALLMWICFGDKFEVELALRSEIGTELDNGSDIVAEVKP